MATILVVDDEMGIRELLSEILSDEGHVVETAENAQHARDYRLRQAPDLVLLDIWMPDTDGVTLLKEWAAQGKKINMAYVFDTARGIKLFADQAFFAVAGDDIAPFLLKKDAEAYAAKNNGKVLGFEDAVKSAVSGGKT